MKKYKQSMLYAILMQKVFLIAAVLFFNSVFANDLYDELQCQEVGRVLYHRCVEVPPNSKECPGLYGGYMFCVTKLNLPKLLKEAKDLYMPNPFSPCKYEIGYLILEDICLEDKFYSK